MFITDTTKIAEIHLRTWNNMDGRYEPEITAEIICDPMEGIWDEDISATVFLVHDVDYVIEYGRDWMNYEGDFYDEESKEYDMEHGIERVLDVDIINY